MRVVSKFSSNSQQEAKMSVCSFKHGTRSSLRPLAVLRKVSAAQGQTEKTRHFGDRCQNLDKWNQTGLHGWAPLEVNEKMIFGIWLSLVLQHISVLQTVADTEMMHSGFSGLSQERVLKCNVKVSRPVQPGAAGELHGSSAEWAFHM